jgi:mannose-6-phosphate isomerase-like protein (cupin superfamily)
MPNACICSLHTSCTPKTSFYSLEYAAEGLECAYAGQVPFTFGVEIFEAGHRTTPHTHPSSQELFFILAGKRALLLPFACPCTLLVQHCGTAWSSQGAAQMQQCRSSKPSAVLPDDVCRSSAERCVACSGEGEAFCDSARFAVGAGDAVVFPPTSLHGIDVSDAGRMYCLELMCAKPYCLQRKKRKK